ncbi:MAG: hypothetical protein ACXVAY_01570 [Mucilaginibacter sp.]
MKTLIKSHITKERERQMTTMEAVCDLLNWTKSDYCWYQYAQYERFVCRLAIDYPEMRTWLRYSAVFRGFWNREWAARDEKEFMPFAYDVKFDAKELLSEYLYLNDHLTLIYDEAFYNRFEHILKLI